MTHANRSCRRRPGAARRALAAVELAFALPFLMPLLFGVWEIGRMLQVQQVLASAASDGARLASMGVYSNSQVTQAVLNAVTLAGVNAPHVAVTVANLTQPGVDATSADRLDALQVTVTLPYSDVSWISSHFFLPATTQIQCQVVWHSARGLDYPTDITVPPGN